MEGLNPCPYCGAEVEMVKLGKTQKEIKEEKEAKSQKKKYTPKPTEFRISCKRCGKTVARGRKFDIETDKQGEERIQQYEAYIKRVWDPKHSTKIRQAFYAEERDHLAAKYPEYNPDDEFFEMHETTRKLCPIA